MLVDSHCHLDYEVFEQDFDDILARAKANGVEILQTISTKVTDFPKLKKIIENSYNRPFYLNTLN